jgi:formylglycine-generating enzyme required for sulfatase activity
MGTADPWTYADDGEGPVHEVSLAPFLIDPTAVTNAQFAAFVAATGYRTDAERFEWAFVFGGLLPDDFEPTRGVAAAPWWRQVYGADWSHPEGPQSNLEDRLDHPVVHVSWRDTTAFGQWSGKRLPTEAEWEYAARGALDGAVFPWGDDLEPDGAHRMNVWQGTFPSQNSLDDGYLGTAPVDAFPPNGFGLYNMTGNVWERGIRRVRAPGRIESCGAGRTCAMRATATGTASGRGAGTAPTAASAISVFVVSATSEREGTW